MLLVIKEIYKKYTEENIANIIYLVLKKYNIYNKFRYYINDNVINNDISLK